MPEGDQAEDNLDEGQSQEGLGQQTNQSDTFSSRGVSSGNVDGVRKENHGQAEERKLAETRGEKTPKGQDLPGGAAPKAQAPKVPSSVPPGGQAVKQALSGGGSVVDKGRQMASAGADAVKKAAKKAVANAAKVATKQALAAFMAAYGWIVWLVLAIIIVIIIIVMAFSNGGDRDISPLGKTETRLVDPIADKEWIQKVMVLAGDNDISKFLAGGYLTGLTSDLALVSAQTIDPVVKTKAEEIKQQIIVLQGLTDAAAKKTQAATILASMKALGILIHGASALPPDIVTTYPIPKEKIIAGKFNRTPHIGTPSFPCGGETGRSCEKMKTHAARTFMQFTKNTCDAADLMTANGTPVYAAFSGKVVEKSESHFKVQLKKGDHVYEAVYGHTTNSLKEGDNVVEGNEIAAVGLSHLHFELAADSKCVVATATDATEAASAGDRIGYAVWKKMATFLRLAP